MNKLNVHSIFESISGEAGFFQQGTVGTFIRLQGCNLACQYCDTAETQANFIEIEIEMEPDAILKRIKTENVFITGGEPLLQRNALFELCEILTESGHDVQIETNGSFPLFNMGWVAWVIDYKCPCAGAKSVEQMLPIKEFTDQLFLARAIPKFVVDIDPTRTGNMPITDLAFTMEKMEQMQKLGYSGKFIISPIFQTAVQFLAQTNALRIIMPELFKFFQAAPHIWERLIFSPQIHKILNLP